MNTMFLPYGREFVCQDVIDFYRWEILQTFSSKAVDVGMGLSFDFVEEIHNIAKKVSVEKMLGFDNVAKKVRYYTYKDILNGKKGGFYNVKYKDDKLVDFYGEYFRSHFVDLTGILKKHDENIDVVIWCNDDYTKLNMYIDGKKYTFYSKLLPPINILGVSKNYDALIIGCETHNFIIYYNEFWNIEVRVYVDDGISAKLKGLKLDGNEIFDSKEEFKRKLLFA